MNNKINLILEKAVKETEKEINNLLVLYSDKKNHDMITHQMLTGGKRIRPVLVFASCKILRGKIKDAIYPAAGIEIIHNYSLIIDDIIDNSSVRRGKPTVWAKYGRSIADCMGIYYLSSAFEASLSAKDPKKILKVFTKVSKIIFEGEILDILFEQAGRKDEPYILKNRYKNIKKKDFLKMVEQKTAALIESSCEIGAICASASENQLKKIKEYGFNLGMAFQISDDILDIFGDEKKFGKKIGKDIEERKGGNCVIYFANEEFSPKKKKEFWNILRKEKIRKQDIDKAINLIKETNAKERAFKYGISFVEKAKNSLSFLPQNEWNLFLRDFASLIMKREK